MLLRRLAPLSRFSAKASPVPRLSHSAKLLHHQLPWFSQQIRQRRFLSAPPSSSSPPPPSGDEEEEEEEEGDPGYFMQEDEYGYVQTVLDKDYAFPSLKNSKLVSSLTPEQVAAIANTPRGRVFCHCLGEEFALESLKEEFDQYGLNVLILSKAVHPMLPDMGHFVLPYDHENNEYDHDDRDFDDLDIIERPPLTHPEGDVFLFPRMGVVVYWNIPMKTRDVINVVLTRVAKNFEGESVSPEDHFGNESIPYHYTDQQFQIWNDTRVLLPNFADRDDDVLIKMACSYGLANNVKLDQLENKLDSLSVEVSSMYQKKDWGSVAMIMGKLSWHVQVVMALNLKHDMLANPSCFWEEGELEKVYEQSLELNDFANRVQVLNQRVEVVKETLVIMMDHKNAAQSHTLEMMIVILFFIEVIFSSLEYFGI